MAEEAEKYLKIRLRFSGGEEFEAQGTPEFIEQQRNYFLKLIGKQNQDVQPTVQPKMQNTAPLVSAQQLPPLETKLSPVQEAFPAKRLWEKLFKEENGLVILRRKMRLEAHEAALLLLAAARVLLNQSACKALDLAKMLQKSGFTQTGRLDRLMQQNTKNDYLQSEGMKRGRTYRLTNAGFARAFVLAEKLAGELL